MPVPTFTQLPVQINPPRWGTDPALVHQVAGADVLALPVLSGGEDVGPLLGPGASEVAEVLGLDLLDALDALGHSGAAGQVVSLPCAIGPDTRLLLLVGVGTGDVDELRVAGAALGRAVLGRTCLATTVAAVADASALRGFVAGLTLASFSLRLGADDPARHPVSRVVLAETAADSAEALELPVASAIAEASWTARTLATVPSNIKNPQWLADQARAVAAQCGLDCQVWDEQELADAGFGGVLAVGQGSATPPRLIRLTYTPAEANRRTPTVALVGKGITFDSGGLSIKPGESMATMKRDMTGGAVVIGVMSALAAVGCPVRVEALVPAAENAIGAAAMRPGDVITQYGGRTTEVTNTDAEGRLVLADALAWAAAELEPTAVVDIATLTGAMKVALGLHTGGFFANDEALAQSIEASSRRAGEAVWRMPLAAAYEDKLASKVADADNAPGGPGAITAALFLQHYVGGLPWAHLDVAPVGDILSDRDEWTAGPSGFGARFLLDWLAGDPLAGIGETA